MKLNEIIKRYDIPVTGIIHVGAHEGQEVEEYLELTDKIQLWEPIPSLAKKLKEKWPKLSVVQVAAWNENTNLDFWVTSFSEGSSALHPKEHEVVDTINVVAKRLDYVDDEDYNVLIIDTQGSELNVLMGCDLNKYDVIVVETNTRQRYEGAPLKEEILDYLDSTHVLVDEVKHSEDGVIVDAQFVRREAVRKTRVAIIPVGGKGERWGNYMGVQKQYAQVNGVPIIERTKAQLGSHGVVPTIVTEGKTVYGEIDKIYNTKEYWNQEGRTIILFGDTFFTSEAMETIMTYPEPQFTVFGRIGPSKFTGKEYGELYAVSFYPEHIPRILKAMERIVSLEKRGAIDTANLWALYRAYHKFPDDMMNRHYAGDGFVEINDFTEDFDWPQDYDRFIERYSE